MVQPLWKIVWCLLRKLKIELPYDSAIPILGIYISRQNYNSKGHIVALFTIAKIWKQPYGEWIKKM